MGILKLIYLINFDYYLKLIELMGLNTILKVMNNKIKLLLQFYIFS